MTPYTHIILKSGKESSVERFHPWIFSGAVKSIEGHVQEGDIVEVYSSKGEYLATGHYQIGSICIRIFSFNREEINREFWKKKLLSAIKLRKTILLLENEHTNVFRLIHCEGDGFPGLIVDYYNGTAVIQAHSIGMFLLRETFAGLLKEIMPDRIETVYNKSEKTLPFKADIDKENSFLLGNSAINEVKENGNRFYIDVVNGQKTGFFVDQRESRLLLQKMAKGKKVLNMFCYTGGFSIAALNGGADLVHSVDSSAKAIEMTNKNVTLNFGTNFDKHQSFATDASSYLSEMTTEYDIIILDPPAFTKHRNVLDKALRGYRNLNKKALEKLKPGGLLFTFSCSQVVSVKDFRLTVFSAATLVKDRKIQMRILQQLSQPADHPINIYHPEGEYLKGLVVQVD